MNKRLIYTICGFAAGVVATLYLSGSLGVLAQLSERPGNSLDNPIDTPKDLSGLSIKNPRTRVVHTKDPAQKGGSMYLQVMDPWLGYQWGRTLTQRNFREQDGVYGEAGKIEGILLPDGATKMMDRSHTNSCASCHNVPYRDAGAGMTIAKNGGSGRNTPHMFGTGLMEMIGLQLRLQALAVADTNRDGWISFAEAKGKHLKLSNLPSSITGKKVEIDFGSFEDKDSNGYPDLNPLFYPIFVDKNGKRVPYAKNLKIPGVAGYTFEVQIFGFGHLYMPFRPPVSTTIRSFTVTPFDIHSGMQACDPVIFTNPNGDALGLVSNAGAQQFVTAAGKDRGITKNAKGISLDDPDRDGYCEELTCGEMDMAEWYLMNHPSPTQGPVTEDIKMGEKLFDQIGCASCHVPDWQLFGHNPKATDYTQKFDGDRRFFDLEVKWNEQAERFEGKIKYLVDKKNGQWLPKKQAYTIRGIYSDFKYHDVGEAFYQMQYDGTIIRKWRTAPLWGAGTTGPYGHDGASLSLDEVIKRHAGEALASKKAYVKLGAVERAQVIAFLNNLVLYQTDQLPCDMDGDGKISTSFMVQDMDTGIERFNPEWLFKVPAKIEGPTTNCLGEPIVSHALVNVRECYGLELEYLLDSDDDGFPDVIDVAPFKPGYKNGLH
jgi:hypothetical protein